jgi:hypothetical protein
MTWRSRTITGDFKEDLAQLILKHDLRENKTRQIDIDHVKVIKIESNTLEVWWNNGNSIKS